MRRYSYVFALLIILTASVEAQSIRKIEPATPGRGDAVTLTFGGEGEGVPDEIRLYFPLANRDATRDLAAEVTLLRSSDDKPQFHFYVPDYVPYGVYDLALTIDSEAAATDDSTEVTTRDLFIGRIRVSLPAAPKASSVSPRVLYPGDPRSITIVGDFDGNPNEYALVLNDRVYPPCRPGLQPGKDCVEVKSALSGRALRFEQIPVDENDVDAFGEQRVRIKVDKHDTVLEQSLLFPWAKRTTPRTLAIWSTIAVIGIVLLPLLLGAVSNQTWLGKLASTGKVLFIDSQTNTYSLSKIQLYLWMLAAVFGWVYLTACLSLVQGHFDFAPLPKNMPGLLLVSLGTATVAGGIGHSRPKGAGSQQPRITDLVTSGDVVVPERVQYLVWTLLGFVAFLLLVLSKDPSTIKELPQVPEEFLYVMGLSSAGYLGGKLVRQPGPILTGASVSPGSIVLNVSGRNLSPSAAVSINGVYLQPAWITKMKGEVLEPDTNTDYAKQLRFRIEDGTLETKKPGQLQLPNEETISGPFTFRLANPDGQAAELALEIHASSKVKAAAGKRSVTVPADAAPAEA